MHREGGVCHLWGNSALPNSSKKGTLGSGALKAEQFSCDMVWFMLASPSPWLTKGFQRSSPWPCGSGKQMVLYHFCYAPGRAYGIMGLGVQCSNPVLGEIVQTASTTGHECRNEVKPKG